MRYNIRGIDNALDRGRAGGPDDDWIECPLCDGGRMYCGHGGKHFDDCLSCDDDGKIDCVQCDGAGGWTRGNRPDREV